VEHGVRDRVVGVVEENQIDQAGAVLWGKELCGVTWLNPCR
jgi:hypothetical protein